MMKEYPMRTLPLALVLVAVAGCERLDNVGRAPSFNSAEQSEEFRALAAAGLPLGGSADASLWSRERTSLLGDRRAVQRGDILTVMIEIDDRAEISNSSSRSRSGSDTMGIPSLLGLPQSIDDGLPQGASLAQAYSTRSNSAYDGDGSVARKEKLTLKVAATVVEVMPNGVLRIEGAQEVRVNFELRELLVSGFVRPEDISRQNAITYDKIAGARISYGGRGQITDVQQPRLGQQVADIILPF